MILQELIFLIVFLIVVMFILSNVVLFIFCLLNCEIFDEPFNILRPWYYKGEINLLDVLIIAFCSFGFIVYAILYCILYVILNLVRWLRSVIIFKWEVVDFLERELQKKTKKVGEQSN